MAEIKERLEETSKACLDAYNGWCGDEKNSEKIEALQETIHELRKATSRLEIELAISERNQNAQKPLAVPSHRSHQKKAQSPNGGSDDTQGEKPQIRRRTPRKKAEG